jgi:hypothetical protein
MTDTDTGTPSWRDTLYIWDGIVSCGIPDPDAKKTSTTTTPLSWEGTWVPVTNVPDAANAEVPKRNAFKEFVDSDCKFLISGTAAENKSLLSNGNEKMKDQDEENEDDDKDEDGHFFIAKLTQGEGWDMKDDEENENGGNAESTKTKKYQDETHDVLVKTLRWSGNQHDQTEFLIVAKGKNEFGPFISVGWQRPGCRWTLARRYLSTDGDGKGKDNKDPRISWSLMELHQAVIGESIEVLKDGSGQKLLKIPPWQSSIMHVNYQEPPKESHMGGRKKRQKTSAVE